MYIPIGPSKKQLYKIILLLLCLLFGFKSCVKAQVLNYGMGESQSQTDQGYIFHNFNSGTGVFKGAGEGQIIYQFLVTGKRNINTIAIQTTNGNTEEPNTCQFASTTGYNDSSTQQVLYSVVCNVDLSGDWRALSIRIWGYAWENTYINWGRIVQFSNFENQQDYTQVLSNVDANLNSISSAVWSIKNNSDSIKQYIESMVTNNTQINNNVSDIKDSINSDNVDNNQANSFFNDFSSNTPEGLVSLINKPLTFLNGLYNTCSPINIYVPYFDFDLSLPCISSIHNGIFDTIIPIARIIINGLICYRLVLGFINIINKLKDPNDSDIEVVDL